MFAEALLGPLLLAAAQLVIPFGHVKIIERPRAPIEESGPLWASRCDGSDDPAKPAPPVRVHGNTYLVGTCGLSSVLIVGDEGDVLIDPGTEAEADLISDNIRELGFRPDDIRIVLTSGQSPGQVGLAALQHINGPAVRQPTGDGQQVRLGNLMLTAMITPGAAPGVSWRWVSCDGGVCRTIVDANDLTPASAPNYRFSDHPAALAAYRASIAEIAASPCEILLTPHPSASDWPKRLAFGQPLFDENACKAYPASVTKQLDERLAKEAAAAK